jgi:RNA polymerase sigma-70 factor (ECF subfamily)
MSPEEIMRTKEMEALVKYAIERLSPRTREIYDLHFTEGLSYEQIAEKLDINTDNVKAKIHQARTRIKEILSTVIVLLSL